MNNRSAFSSQNSGHDAAYAVDNSSGTWWEPAATDTQPTLTVELSPATRFDPVQLFTIDSARLMFTGGGFGSGRGRGTARGADPATGPAPPASAPAANVAQLPAPGVYQYKIEASMDGTAYKTVLDQTTNTTPRNTLFEEFPPTQCRFVRLTLTNWPRTTPLGIIEFTAFGKSSGTQPAEVATPPAR